MKKISASSRARVQAFVDEFIRGDAVAVLTEERDQDYGGHGTRAERCYAAAEHGEDGKTHSEVIEDWRDAFRYWCEERRRGRWSEDPDRFIAAVNAHFDEVEAYHEKAGTLYEEIG